MEKDFHTSAGLAMTLQIRDARAHDLARILADKRQVSMTEAVIQALESELRRETEKRPLAERIGRIATDLRSHAKRQPRILTRDEVDAIWGPP